MANQDRGYRTRYWRSPNASAQAKPLKSLASTWSAAAVCRGPSTPSPLSRGARRSNLIDGEARPAGVTHADCEFISHQVGTILDVEDVIPGGHYTLEVSSPGVERKLTKPRDFERFVGHKVKVALRQPVDNQRTWIGALTGFTGGIITLEPAPGKNIQIPARASRARQSQVREW